MKKSGIVLLFSLFLVMSLVVSVSADNTDNKLQLCPDVNADGIIDKADQGYIEGLFGASKQTLSYFKSADLDIDGDVDMIDLGFVIQAQGKSLIDYEQCDGITIKIVDKVEERGLISYKEGDKLNSCQDINGDKYVNKKDLDAVAKSFGKKVGESGFNIKADLNNDGVIDIADQILVSKAVGSLALELKECGGKYREKLCPDLNANGIVDKDDLEAYSELHGGVAGDEDYYKILDYAENGKIDIVDISLFAKAVGTPASEYRFCTKIGELEKEFDGTGSTSDGVTGKGVITTMVVGQTVLVNGHKIKLMRFGEGASGTAEVKAVFQVDGSPIQIYQVGPVIFRDVSLEVVSGNLKKQVGRFRFSTATCQVEVPKAVPSVGTGGSSSGGSKVVDKCVLDTDYTCSDIKATSDGIVSAAIKVPSSLGVDAYSIVIEGGSQTDGCDGLVTSRLDRSRMVTIECKVNPAFTRFGNPVSGTITLSQKFGDNLITISEGTFTTGVEKSGNEVVEVPAARKGLTTAAEAPKRGFFGRLANSLGLAIFDVE